MLGVGVVVDADVVKVKKMLTLGVMVVEECVEVVGGLAVVECVVAVDDGGGDVILNQRLMVSFEKVKVKVKK